MPIDFPLGIAAQGNGALYYLPAVVSTAAPKVTEFTAGINVSCAIDGFNPTTDQGTVAITRYCSTVNYETPGRVSYTGPTIQFVYDPQDPESAEYEWATTIAEGVTGYLANRLGVDVDTDIAIGQYVNLYPITAGPQVPVPIDPTAEGAELRYSQRFFITGPPILNVAVVA